MRATVPPQQFSNRTPTFEIATVRDFGGMRVTGSGRAPRTRYDGTVYRLAWIDSSLPGDDQLTIAEYLPGGTVSAAIPLPGWLPSGDNGFTLLRDGSRVWLIIVSPSELSVLGLCT